MSQHSVGQIQGRAIQIRQLEPTNRIAPISGPFIGDNLRFHFTIANLHCLSAIMTMEEPPQHPPADGVVNGNGAQNQQLQVPSTFPSQPPSVADTASTVGNGSHAKVAIPRHRGGVAPRYNRRVPRACESCRQRKTKCSGDTPICRQCRELRATCKYPVGWKEKTKK